MQPQTRGKIPWTFLCTCCSQILVITIFRFLFSSSSLQPQISQPSTTPRTKPHLILCENQEQKKLGKKRGVS
ncbi:hypothetical protein OIU84_006962 [Salix udensis]|uniref:Uncharacterized protein n=1 Tax=Salix udensis TaxID=889485 RepID=A0AAD6K0H1_9ROSI|nr:hypothetical protein OIU84_006962 [Salix udensis]